MTSDGASTSANLSPRRKCGRLWKWGVLVTGFPKGGRRRMNRAGLQQASPASHGPSHSARPAHTTVSMNRRPRLISGRPPHVLIAAGAHAHPPPIDRGACAFKGRCRMWQLGSYVSALGFRLHAISGSGQYSRFLVMPQPFTREGAREKALERKAGRDFARLSTLKCPLQIQSSRINETHRHASSLPSPRGNTSRPVSDKSPLPSWVRWEHHRQIKRKAAPFLESLCLRNATQNARGVLASQGPAFVDRPWEVWPPLLDLAGLWSSRPRTETDGKSQSIEW
ncbi:uncharacterized protein VTP21DRAFT_1456 [Calcarisporiella thermophila]|uniref:uncharacterized protein n=1 Tax=Calcarisporiella thermophila TaxID=911321 RepID=UPI00374409A4